MQQLGPDAVAQRALFSLPGNTSAKGHVPFVIFALLDVLRAFPGQALSPPPCWTPESSTPSRACLFVIIQLIGNHVRRGPRSDVDCLRCPGYDRLGLCDLTPFFVAQTCH